MFALSEGIDDELNDKRFKRHVQSVTEINRIIKTKFEEELSDSSLYHYLKKLVDAKIVDEVAKIKLPNQIRKTSYFSKAAKVVINDLEDPSINKNLDEHSPTRILTENKFSEFLGDKVSKEAKHKMDAFHKNVKNMPQMDHFADWFNSN